MAAAKIVERAGEKSKVAGAAGGARKKLSYKETRELETMEDRIAEAEKELQGKHEMLLDPQVMSDSVRLRELSLELEGAQERIDEMYARWGELEKRSKDLMK